MFIRTERLFLRPGWPEDMQDLRDLANEGGVVCSTSAVELDAYLSRPRDVLLPHLFINLRGDNGSRLIGGVGLSRSGDEVELGYWLARKYRGHGYAAEALQAVLAEARMLGHRRIIAKHVADGEAPARVLEQSGFKLASAGRAADARVRLYVANLTDKLFNLLGVGPNPARA